LWITNAYKEVKNLNYLAYAISCENEKAIKKQQHLLK